MKVEHIQWLEDAGWTKRLIDGRYGHFYIDLPDRRLISFSLFIHTSAFIQWTDTGSLSTHAYRLAREAISGKKASADAWITQRRNSRSYDYEYEGDYIKMRTKFLIDWCRSLNIREELESCIDFKKRNQSSSSLGPITALATLGRVEQLEEHYDRFKKGQSPYGPAIKERHFVGAIKHAKFLQ